MTGPTSEMQAKIMAMLTDKKMKAKLKKTSQSMRAKHGPTKAAKVIDGLVEAEDQVMPTNLTSSAPHLESPATYAGPLKDWGHQPNPIAGNSKSDGVLLFKGPNNQPECGLWQVTPGTWPLSIPRDEVLPLRLGPRHLHPRERRSDRGHSRHRRAVQGRLDRHLHGARNHAQRLHAELTKHPRLRTNPVTITLDSTAPHLLHPESYPGPFKDWGVIPTMIEGESRTSGLVLYKGPNGESETGIWIATPGYLELPCDERRVLPLPAGPLHLYP